MAISQATFSCVVKLVTCALLGLVAIVALTLAASYLFPLNLGPPFLLIVEKNDDGATVQFVKDDVVKSEKFPISIPISHPYNMRLTRQTAEVPNGTIEFSDTTVLPGQFRIRFGDDTFDVMWARIIVNDKNYFWPDEKASTK